MGYNAVPTVATGDVWSAANHNTYIRDNFAAGVPDIFTAAGDLVYATAANAAAPLAIGTVGQALLSSSDGLPEWGDVFKITARQGGSATSWITPGTTNYTPGNSAIQCGVLAFTLPSESGAKFFTITFPVEFAYAPVAVVSYSPNTWENLYPSNCSLSSTPTKTQMQVAITRHSGASSSTTVTGFITWIAIGPVA